MDSLPPVPPEPATKKDGEKGTVEKILNAFLANYHVSASSIICLGCGLGVIWMPSHKEQFIETNRLSAMWLASASLVTLRKQQ
jgi:hypothetical protein